MVDVGCCLRPFDINLMVSENIDCEYVFPRLKSTKVLIPGIRFQL